MFLSKKDGLGQRMTWIPDPPMESNDLNLARKYLYSVSIKGLIFRILGQPYSFFRGSVYG